MDCECDDNDDDHSGVRDDDDDDDDDDVPSDDGFRGMFVNLIRRILFAISSVLLNLFT